jgi:predicted enzyme related to lactoylglutathione lyase
LIEVHAYIEVADLERAIAFYCDGLGLTLKRRFSPSWVELGGANLPVFLLGNRPPTAALGSTQIRRNFGRHWTPVHLDFIVPDIDAAVARLSTLGATLDREIQQAEYGHMANMADPFGNGFDLIEFSGPGYDAVSR